MNIFEKLSEERIQGKDFRKEEKRWRFTTLSPGASLVWSWYPLLGEDLHKFVVWKNSGYSGDPGFRNSENYPTYADTRLARIISSPEGRIVAIREAISGPWRIHSPIFEEEPLWS